MQTATRRIQGCDGLSIHLIQWTPDDILAARGVIQLLHGQGEYAARYTHVAQVLTDNGFIVYAPDLRGHGETVFNPVPEAREEHCIPGHMADHDGWNKCLADFEILRELIRSEQPLLPLFLLGHSLGSLMAQDLLMENSSLWQGAVLLGSTGGPLALRHRAIDLVVQVQRMVKGARGAATWTDALVMQAFAKEIGMQQYRSEWLSHDPEVILAAEADPMMNFPASAQHWVDLGHALKKRVRPENIASIRSDIPIWIASGGNCPMGEKGKAVTALADSLRAAGLTDVSMKLYEGMNHELHNELCREEFLADLAGWFDAQAPR